MRDWVTEIQNGIGEALSKQGTPTPCSGKDKLAQLRKEHTANRSCADCGAADPNWVSLSLGVLICIECSGVHRSLGSHISKVRSFELDHWEATTELEAGSITNFEANAELEAIIPIGRDKPVSTSDRETRERWILDKYVHKKFAKKEFVRPVTSMSLTLSEVSLPSPRLSSPSPLSASVNLPLSPLSPSRSLSPRDPALSPQHLALRLPPGFAEYSAARPRTPECMPTSHIGANVFAKKTPYNSALNSARRGSLASFLATTQNPALNRATTRRNSMFHAHMM